MYIAGSNWCICEECGAKRRASDVVIRWDGLVVCHEKSRCNEERHPQEFIQPVTDNTLPAVVAPEPPDTFIAPGSVTAEDL